MTLSTHLLRRAKFANLRRLALHLQRHELIGAGPLPRQKKKLVELIDLALSTRRGWY